MKENSLLNYLSENYINRLRYIGPEELLLEDDISVFSILLRALSLGFYIRKRRVFPSKVISWGQVSENKKAHKLIRENPELFEPFSLDDLLPKPLFNHIYYDQDCSLRAVISEHPWEKIKGKITAIKHIDSSVFWAPKEVKKGQKSERREQKGA